MTENEKNTDTMEPTESSAGIGPTFMRKTYYKYLDKSQQAQGLPQPPLESAYNTTGRVHTLPAPDKLDLSNVDLHALIEARQTLRNYADTPLTLEELSFLLWATQGIKSVDTVRRRTARTVPSAGARHAFETLVLVNRVDGLTPGLYRYLASAHTLVTVSLSDDLAEQVAAACMGQGQVTKSAVTFLWVAVVERMYWRYGERGYRYLHLDAGHVCQNLYLAAEPLQCGVCAIAAFYDEELNALLELDGEEQFVIYIATLGKKL